MPLYPPDLTAWTGQLACGDANGFNTSSNTSYYFGTLFGVDPGTSDNPPGYFIARNARLVSAFGRFAVVGTTASTHTCKVTIRKNGTTDIYTVSTSVVLTAAINDYNNSTAAAVDVNQGDWVYARFDTPAFTTNATAVFANLVLSFEGR